MLGVHFSKLKPLVLLQDDASVRLANNFAHPLDNSKHHPGGMSGGVGATMRRFKAQMRGIKSGKKKTGLMKPHLAVEMSHRGIQTKQPLSKDPQKYTQYKGQSEARKILGGARTTFSPHARYGARSNQAGPTGAGRLSGLMAGQSGQMGSSSTSSYAPTSYASYASYERTTTTYPTYDAANAIQRTQYARSVINDDDE